jgi:hypothetical protein
VSKLPGSSLDINTDVNIWKEMNEYGRKSFCATKQWLTERLLQVWNNDQGCIQIEQREVESVAQSMHLS